MGKYDPIREWLTGKGREVHATFAELDRMVDGGLAPSARKYQAWWSGHPDRSPLQVQKRSWNDAGYKVALTDLETECVVFRRIK